MRVGHSSDKERKINDPIFFRDNSHNKILALQVTSVMLCFGSSETVFEVIIKIKTNHVGRYSHSGNDKSNENQ